MRGSEVDEGCETHPNRRNRTMIDDRQGTPMTAATRSYRRRRGLPYAAALAAVFVVAGCNVGDPGPAVATPPVSTSATSTTTPATTLTTTAAPTSTGPTFPSGLPNAAKAHNAKGAEVFVSYFIDTLNKAWTKPDASLFTGLCRFETSKSCTAYRKTAADLEKNKQRYDGNPVTIDRVSALSVLDGKRRVLFRGIQERRSVVDSSGAVVLTDSRRDLNFMFLLDWGQTGWILHDVKLVNL